MTQPVNDSHGLDGSPADNALIEAVGIGLADAVFTIEAGLARLGVDITTRQPVDGGGVVLMAPALGPGDIKITVEHAGTRLAGGSSGTRDGFAGDPCGPAGDPA